jgi:hypothetical protein
MVMPQNNDVRKDSITLGIINGQSVQNADTAREKGYDVGKKVSGLKRHIVVDTIGPALRRHSHGGNVTDRRGVVEMIALHADILRRIQKFIVDVGYSGKKFADEEVYQQVYSQKRAEK